MIFEVQNLGNINHAKIDLSKNLILFTGQNNTGKTYLSYAIYGLSHFYEDQPNEYLSNKLLELYDSKNIEIDLRKVFPSLRYSKAASLFYKRHLETIFGSEQSSFDNSAFELYWNSKEELIQKLELSVHDGIINLTYGKLIKDNGAISLRNGAKVNLLKKKGISTLHICYYSAGVSPLSMILKKVTEVLPNISALFFQSRNERGDSTKILSTFYCPESA